MKKKKTWLRSFFILIGLIVLGIISGVIGLRMVIKGGEVEVPDLTGESMVSALEDLNNINLRLEVTDQQFHSQIPANHIISQFPAGGDVVKGGRKITVKLSKGTQIMGIPALAGKSWYEAQGILRKSGLVLGDVAKVHSDSVPVQNVIAQSPSDASIKRGDKVNLLLSDGPAADFYMMPDFVGKNSLDVRKELKIMGLSQGTLTYQVYQGISSETVINQVPPAGYRIKKGTLVDLVVSK